MLGSRTSHVKGSLGFSTGWAGASTHLSEIEVLAIEGGADAATPQPLTLSTLTSFLYTTAY
jgi:hypothetical protein